MSDTPKPRPWWESQKVMVSLIVFVVLAVSLTVLVALGRMELTEGLFGDVLDFLAIALGVLVGGRALEGAASNLRRDG